MSRRRNRKRRKARKGRVAEEALKPRSPGRSRPSGALFVGKARRGDEAELRFQFSGVPVPFNEDDPSAGLEEATLMVAEEADA